MNRIAGLLLLMLAWLAAPAAAQERMRVSLVPETTNVAPGGSVALAIVMEPADGWHGYWRNPGDAGAEPRISWQLPAGWSAGPLQYPVPDRLLLIGLMNYAYERDHALLTRLAAPEDAAPGDRIPVRARLDYLVCSDELCVPETAELAAELVVGAPAAPHAAFAEWRAALPRPLADPARFAVESGRLRLAVPVPPAMAVDSAYFYAAAPNLVRHEAPQSVSRSGEYLVVEVDLRPGAAVPDRIEGVLEIGDGLGLDVAAGAGPVPPPGEAIAPARAPVGAATILAALLGALAGGLLLNVMPCVFPIIGLKALSLARAGEAGSSPRREAMAYAAGIMITCLLLGALLLALRAGGESLGWAFQLQDPRVILFLLLLVTAIALNLAGLYALPAFAGGGTLAASGGVRGAFFTGALAAFVATPCTGPFMGFALGAALILPTWAALAIFAGLGLGLALPFLLLGFVPALRRKLPRPGPWMERLQRILSIPMFLTALALAWILGRQSGVDGMTLGLAAVLVLGLALWWLGRSQGRRATLVPLVVAAIAMVAPLPFVRPAATAASAELAGMAFGEARLARLRADNVPVFLYFTADWCITCKVNERAALNQAEVASAFRARGIQVMAGDWTRGDAEIGRFLERNGRSGVPFYIYYHPGREPEILPQILTVSRLTRLGE